MSVFSGFAKWKNNTNHVNLVLDVIYHKTYPIYVRIRAAEIFKKRNPVQSLPVLLEMVNSFLDTDIYKDEDIDTIWHFT